MMGLCLLVSRVTGLSMIAMVISMMVVLSLVVGTMTMMLRLVAVLHWRRLLMISWRLLLEVVLLLDW